MIYPKFVPNSFWNYTEACELVGTKYPAAPLGLITVAAMLPKHWDIRLVNRNTELLADADLDWADLVMIGGMLNQQPDAIHLIELAHRHGKPVCVGGPAGEVQRSESRSMSPKIQRVALGSRQSLSVDTRARPFGGCGGRLTRGAARLLRKTLVLTTTSCHARQAKDARAGAIPCLKKISLFRNSDLSYKRITLTHERGGSRSSRNAGRDAVDAGGVGARGSRRAR
jgi:hypothetical protein